MATSKCSTVKGAQIPSICHLCEDSKPIPWQCIDCDLFMCDNCKVNVHSKIKSTDTHDVISLKETGEEHAAKSSILNIKCKTHPGNEICLYCINCDEVLCPSCVSEFHNKHHLESIDKIHEDTVGNLSYIKDELQADLKIFIDNEKKNNEKSTSDKRTYEATKTDIQRHLAEIKRRVDERGEKMLMSLKENWTEVENANKSQKSNILRVQKDLRSKISAVKQALDKNDTVASVKCEKKVSSEWEHRQKIDKNEIKLMKFSPGKVEEGKVLLNIIGPVHQCKEPGIRFDEVNSQRTDMNIITNMYACKDGHVFVCDEYCTQTMTKKVLWESELQDIQHFKELRVFDITETDKHEFIVSFINKTCLKRIKPCGTMEDYLDFTPWLPRALHFTQDGRLLVSGREEVNLSSVHVTENNDRKIKVIDSNGKLLYSFGFEDAKKRIFSYVFRIKTLTNNDIVIID